MTKALYPGTFDPMTLGHQDIITRAAAFCEELYIGVAAGHHKQTLFSLEERSAMAQDIIEELGLSARVKILPYEGLLVDLCRKHNISLIIRGVRSVGDFEYEYRLAAMNHHLADEIETLFMLPSERFAFLSSSLVRESAKLGGDVSALLAPKIKKNLLDKLGSQKNYV